MDNPLNAVSTTGFRYSLIACVVCLMGWIFSASVVSANSVQRIFGIVYAESGGETLPGAHVYIEESGQGVVTNNYGYYSISLSSFPATLVFSYVGYETQRVEILAGDETRKDVYLKPVHELKGVEIQAQSIQSFHKSPQMSMLSLPATQIQSTPVLLGEKDLFKVLQMMPGVKGGNEGSSGLYVRGGGSDQNLILLDDAVAYNVNHMFGVFSLFNGDAIKHVQLWKGGFPARYGGRVSSVLDINMQEGNNERYSGEIGLGIISSRFTLNGPVSKGKGSFLLSGRRTYHDLWLNHVMMEREKTSYYFYDLNAKANWVLNPHNRLYLSSYFGRDKMVANDYDQSFRNQSGLAWQNALVSFRWNHLFSGGAFANTTLIFSDYDTQIFVLERNRLDPRKYRMDYTSGVRDFGLKYDLHFNLGQHHSLRAGAATTGHFFRPASVHVQNDFAKIYRKEAFTLTSLESGIYIEDEIQYNKWMFNAGMRVSQYYHDRKNYVRPEPRFNAAYALTSSTSLKASYAIMNQYLHLSSNTGTGMPTSFWLPATGKLLPQSSVQYAAGFATMPRNSNIEISLEGYFKKTNNALTYSNNASFLLFDEGNAADPFQNWESNMVQGEAEAKGIEFMIHRKSGRLNGWMGYTLSFARNRFEGINNRNWYETDHNRRHDLSLVLSYAFSKKATLGVNWVYASGRMMTLPMQTTRVFVPEPLQQSSWSPGQFIYTADLFDTRNNWKAHNYHRLDVSMRFSKPLRFGTRTWELGVYNAYNRMNPFQYNVYTDYHTGERRLKQRTLLPLIPSATYSFKF
jgi:outer membrane cobalamin receptor